MTGYSGEHCTACGDPLYVGEELFCDDPACRPEVEEATSRP